MGQKYIYDAKIAFKSNKKYCSFTMQRLSINVIISNED